MDKLPKDVLYTLALELDLPNLLRWCESHPSINNKVCNNPNVWTGKLLRDFPDYKNFYLNKSFREIYNYLYRLTKVKEKLKMKESIYEIFLMDQFKLDNKRLKTLPDLDLPNLQKLNLSSNELKTLPKLNLPNLVELYVANNQLQKLPELNLPNLNKLYLRANNLRNLPKLNLPNLTQLSLRENRFTKLPELNLPKLQSLDLSANEFDSLPIFNFPDLKSLNMKDNQLPEREKIIIKKKYSTVRV